MKEKAKTVVLRMPAAAWDTIRESVELDAESSSADPELRKQIRKALGKVEESHESKPGFGEWHRQVAIVLRCNIPSEITNKQTIVAHVRGFGNLVAFMDDKELQSEAAR